MSSSPQRVMTVGHSTHSLERFLDLLERNQVTAIADVRSKPFSRHNPQFNRDSILAALRERGIAYVFVGKELGARSNDPACYEGGQVKYSRLAKTALFKSGIERILRGSDGYRIALMCAEKEPLDCHRTLLVARELDALGVNVSHILADGSVEDHSHTMSRLLDMVGLPQEDMFRSRAELIGKACEMREQKIAYVEAQMEAS